MAKKTTATAAPKPAAPRPAAAAKPATDAAPATPAAKASTPRATSVPKGKAAAASATTAGLAASPADVREITHQMIAERAYFKWQNGHGGDEGLHWAEAERELRDGAGI